MNIIRQVTGVIAFELGENVGSVECKIEVCFISLHCSVYIQNPCRLFIIMFACLLRSVFRGSLMYMSVITRC